MKKHNGFSLIEVLMLFAALSVILAVSTPLLTKQHKNVPQKIPHGFYQCYRDENNNLHEELYNTFRRIDKNGDNPVEKCSFDPPAEATMFKITLIGGGTGGYSYAHVDDTNFNSYISTYELDGEYNRNHLYTTLEKSQLSKALAGLDAIFCSERSADGGSGSGVRQEFKTPGGLQCKGGTPSKTDMTVTGWDVTVDVTVLDRRVTNPQPRTSTYTKHSEKVNKTDAEDEVSNYYYDKEFDLAQANVGEGDDDVSITVDVTNSTATYDPDQVAKNEIIDNIAKLEASYSGDTSIDVVMSEISKTYEKLCKDAGSSGIDYLYAGYEQSLTGYGGSGGNGRYYKKKYTIGNSTTFSDYEAYLKKIPNAGISGYCSDSGCYAGFSTDKTIISTGKNGDYYQLIARGIIERYTSNPLTDVTTSKEINPGCDKKPTAGTDGVGYGALKWTEPGKNSQPEYYTVKSGTGGTLGDVTLEPATNTYNSDSWYRWVATDGTDGVSDPNGVDSCAKQIPKCEINTNRIIKYYDLGGVGTQGSLETFTKFGLGKVPCSIQVGIGGNPKKYDSTRQAYKGSDLLDIDTVLSCSGTYIKVNGGRDDTGKQIYKIKEYIPAYLPNNGKAYIQGLGPDMGLYSGYTPNKNTKDTHDHNTGLLEGLLKKAQGDNPKFTYPTLWLRYIAKKNIPFGKAGDGTQLWDRCVWPQGTMTYYGSYGSGPVDASHTGSIDIPQAKCSTSDYTGGDSAGNGTWKDTPVSGSKGIGGGVFIRW